ncbi:MAG: hypothetical protein JWQ27_196 [Ferruginibacter sp.]|nr:hypothetical protein [Ferruginibacter sp.]
MDYTSSGKGFGLYTASSVIATRTNMSLLMGAAMAVLMMLMMGRMYPNKKFNTAIICGGVLIFVFALAGLRNQTGVGDKQYVRAMIPHHSSAIMVSKSAKLKDPELKALSERIIAGQEKEIAEMRAILRRAEDLPK